MGWLRLRTNHVAFKIIFALLYMYNLYKSVVAFDEYLEYRSPFTAEDCANIKANGTCNCYRDKYNLTKLECVNAQLNISVNMEYGIELNCGNELEPHMTTSLPRLGSIRESTFIATHNCKYFTELLLQLELTPRHTLYVHGLAGITHLSLNTFGHDLKRLQKVTILELRAEQKTTAPFELASHARQELDANILTPMPALFRLTIELNYTELPADLLAPVPNINDITLLGRLLEFPRATFRVLKRLRELSMREHQFEHRLHPEIFQNLTMIRGLYWINCSITFLPAHIFSPLKLLQRLNLMDNRLSELPAALLAQQQRLQTLNLSGNRLQALPLRFFEATSKLLKLILSRNRLRHLDARILPPLTAMIELSADNNELRTISTDTFAQPNRLQGLDLRNNQLSWAAGADCIIFAGLSRLQRLLLSFNSIEHLCDRLGTSNHSTSALTVLDVRQNQLKLLSPQLINTLNTSIALTTVYLSENPWSCNCSAQPLLNLVKSNRKRLADARYMRCADKQLSPLRELSYRDFCLPEIGVRTVLVVILVCLIALGLILTTTALCYYKYRIELKIWLYAHRLCLCCVSERDVDRDRKWDAFISYSHHDEEFVEKELVPGLEHGTPAFKTCIHVRDWLAGAYIPEQIIDSVVQSRRTIIVLSQNFIESDWAQMEFRTAHQCAVNEGRSRIILVVYGEILNTELLDQELRAYLKTNTYLKWGDPWFWRKLRYAMPHAECDGGKLRSDLGEKENADNAMTFHMDMDVGTKK
ncbi:protein toll-like [Ceratitis capitata]|uniref:protein toll-like n=1 Tax=Ceratitis capitata TaxID=7213 RepID=UPI00032A1254|nr:protein toll-like [Ceratitis capitata]